MPTAIVGPAAAAAAALRLRLCRQRRRPPNLNWPRHRNLGSYPVESSDRRRRSRRGRPTAALPRFRPSPPSSKRSRPRQTAVPTASPWWHQVGGGIFKLLDRLLPSALCVALLALCHIMCCYFERRGWLENDVHLTIFYSTFAFWSFAHPSPAFATRASKPWYGSTKKKAARIPRARFDFLLLFNATCRQYLAAERRER